jgi:hypothetical protein
MPIRTIEVVVKIDEDRRLVIQLPSDVPVGRHRLVAVLDETPEGPSQPTDSRPAPWTFPVISNANWPADMPLTREEMYDDDGR